MKISAVGLVTSAYIGEGKDAGYVRFTDLVNGAALNFRVPAADTNRLKPFVGQAVELQAEFTVNEFRTKDGDTQLSLELLSVMDVRPVKVSVQPVAPPNGAKVPA